MQQDLSERDVLDLMEKIISAPYCSTTVIEYTLTALAKLSHRLRASPGALDIIKQIMGRYVTKVELEI